MIGELQAQRAERKICASKVHRRPCWAVN